MSLPMPGSRRIWRHLWLVVIVVVEVITINWTCVTRTPHIKTLTAYSINTAQNICSPKELNTLVSTNVNFYISTWKYENLETPIAGIVTLNWTYSLMLKSCSWKLPPRDICFVRMGFRDLMMGLGGYYIYLLVR